MQPRQHRFEINELRLNVMQWGKPGDPAIVLLHGLRSNGRTWDALAQRLHHRYHVIALDQRGRGLSDWDAEQRYQTSYYVDDLAKLVEQLDLQRFTLIGHSMGAVNALVFCQQYPSKVSALVMEDMGPEAAIDSAGARRTRKELSATPLFFRSRELACEYLQLLRPGLSREGAATRVDATMHEQADGQLHWSFDLAGIRAARLNASPTQSVDLWPALRSMEVPTLIVRGERSDYVSDDLTARMIDCSRHVDVETVADATHFVHDDNFVDYVNCIESFLRRLAD